MVAVARLTLTDVRSHAALVLVAGPGLVVITGDNGAGKTNILEAVSLLAPGRGLRGASLGEVARVGGAGGFAIAATVMAVGGEVELGTGALAAAPERRVVRVNGAARPASALGEWLSVVWLTPAMDRLFAESAGGRRRFLDRLVLALHPGHARETVRYEAAMRARSRLLAGELGGDPGWLSALEAAMAEHGAAVHLARAETVSALAGVLETAQDDGFARPLMRLDNGMPDFPAGELVEGLKAALKRGRAQDAAAGRALVGPHRADLRVMHGGKGVPAGQASTGEQKALLIAIVLAHAAVVRARMGTPPLMLLDEIAAHLDGARRQRLFERLAETGAQVWMTGTDRALFEAAGVATRLQLEGGIVRAD